MLALEAEDGAGARPRAAPAAAAVAIVVEIRVVPGAVAIAVDEQRVGARAELVAVVQQVVEEGDVGDGGVETPLRGRAGTVWCRYREPLGGAEGGCLEIIARACAEVARPCLASSSEGELCRARILTLSPFSNKPRVIRPPNDPVAPTTKIIFTS